MNRRPVDERSVLYAVAAIAGLLALVVPWLAWSTAARLDPNVPRPGGLGGFVSRWRELGWPSAATPWLAGYIVVLLAATMAGGVLWAGRARRRAGVTGRVAHLPTDRPGLTRYRTGTGPAIGQVVTAAGRVGPTIRMTVEDQGLVIAGPRTGKTTTLAVPAALNHPGPAIITSNKADIYEAVAATRARLGRVWLFDPQHLITSEAPSWWWNPLEAADTVPDARRLARTWFYAARSPQARTDAYFDGAGEELLAGMILAAAHTPTRRLSDVFRWLAAPDDPTPAEILEPLPGLGEMAAGLRGAQGLPDKQRAGVYSSAARTVAWLADPAVRAWIEDPAGTRPCWSATSLADSTDTLISISREGEGSAAPLITAMTAVVLQAAERMAATSPGGRLAQPLLGVLDEAANVVRWQELPDLYSHYGSRGIILVSYAQSWAQLAEAFGPNGAEKLWSAANVRVYGGGVSDTTFLRRLSDLAGEHDETIWTTSTTTARGGQRSRGDASQVRRVPVFDVATLAAWPPRHALVMLSAARPVVVRLTPYWETARNLAPTPVAAAPVAP